MINILRYFLIFLILLPTISYAQTLTPQQELNQETLLRQQNARLEREINNQRLEQNIRKSKPKTEYKQDDEQIADKDVKHCFPLKKVIYKNSELLSKRRKKRLSKEFIGECITPSLITKIVRKTTNYYVAKGFVTTRIYIDPQNIKTGNLELLALEGKLDEIQFFDNKKSQYPMSSEDFSAKIPQNDGKFPIKILKNTEKLSAFGLIEGKYFNIRDIEQGLEQINKLSSNNATMKIVPSKKEGYSNVLISKNKKDKNTRISVGLNNSGQDQTGLYNGRIFLEQDNLLKANDSIMLVGTHSLSKFSTQRSGNIYSNIAIPFGMWNFNSSFIKSSYLSTIQGTNKEFETSGSSTFQKYKLDRKVFRNKIQRVSLFTGLDLKSTKNYIEDTLNATGSRKLSVLSLGLNHNIVSSKLGYFDYTLTYLQGLNSFGAKSDSGIQNNFTPQAQYKKYTLDISYYKQFKKFYVTSNLSSQYSEDPLFSSEQIIIGDAYSVRGFREKSALGDSGFYITNNINYPLLPLLSNKLNIFNLNKVLKKTEIFLGYDYGYVKQKGGQSSSFGEGKGILSGLSLGTKFASTKLTFDVTFSHTLKTESYIPAGWEVYSNLKWRLN